MSHNVDYGALRRQYINDIGKQRRKAITRHRIGNGVVELFRHPWKLIFVTLLMALCIVAWANRAVVMDLTLPHIDPLFAELWNYTISALIILLSALLLVGLLQALGTPRHSKRIEEDLAHIGFTDHYGYPPAPLSYRQIKHSEVSTVVFYSHGLRVEAWEKEQTAIEAALNLHYVEPPQYGGRKHNNGRFVILTVAPGAVGVRREETLYDDEL